MNVSNDQLRQRYIGTNFHNYSQPAILTAAQVCKIHFLLFKCAKNSPSAAVIQIGKNEEMSELTLNQSRTAGESGKTTFIAHFSTDIWWVLVEPYH